MAVDGPRTILHVDLDSFFASVEVLLDPALAGRPVIVGGKGPRGVVASCTYEARAYGIHSAMPSVQAQRLCPGAVFLPGRYDVYAEHSARFHAILRSFTPLVEGISLDEAFLDVSGARSLLGEGAAIAEQVRRRVRAELSLGCGVGVATNKLLAKLASKAAKPRPSRQGPIPGPGVVVVAPDEVVSFLHPLPVRALWGVGPATHRRLERFGVRTVADLAAIPLDTLVTAFGQSHGRHLHDQAMGRDDRPVVASAEAKSVGHEETYARDLHDPAECGRELVRMGDAVGSRLRDAGTGARTVTLKVRFGDFRTITRSRTLPAPTDDGRRLAEVARSLLAEVDVGPGVRLLGVAASNLGPLVAEQLSFDDAARPAADAKVADAVDEIRRRFGAAAVGPAALVGKEGLRLKRRGDTQWGPGTAGAPEPGDGR